MRSLGEKVMSLSEKDRSSDIGAFLRVPEPRSRRRAHRCHLPATDYPSGSIWRCPCGRRWKLVPTRYDALMGDVTHAAGRPLAWVRRIAPWPRRAVAETLTRALESSWPTTAFAPGSELDPESDS
jgi:hypothetical protein